MDVVEVLLGGVSDLAVSMEVAGLCGLAVGLIMVRGGVWNV